MEKEKRYTITLDDDPSISKIIAQVTGIPSHPFTSGESLLKEAHSLDPVAAFVDVHLEMDGCGLDSIPRFRKIWPFTPIIVVTSDTKGDLIGQALAMGANDFIRKPINAHELTGRLHARILEMSTRRKHGVTEIGDIKFSPGQASVTKNGQVAYLPKLETQLLGMLLEQRDLIVPRDELKQRLWGRIAVSENTLDRKISDIRKALADVGSSCMIQSHYKKGISLRFIEGDVRSSSQKSDGKAS
ncbi:MAG: response regulator transcription factor [Chitinophagaceae bacterium]|nr:response regulator transcription factor [Oligoflexus sp.]